MSTLHAALQGMVFDRFCFENTRRPILFLLAVTALVSFFYLKDFCLSQELTAMNQRISHAPHFMINLYHIDRELTMLFRNMELLR